MSTSSKKTDLNLSLTELYQHFGFRREIRRCLFLATSDATNVIILSVHVGANPLYGYYAAAPVYEVAVKHIRQNLPTTFSNLTYTSIYLPGYDLCPDGGDHTAEFFTAYYYKHREQLRVDGSYLVLATPECTNQALVLADYARNLDLPLFISVAGDSSLTNRRRYPTTSAVAPLSGNDILTSTEGLLRRYAWRTLSLICDSMTDSPGLANFFYARCKDIQRFLERKGYTWYPVEYDSAKQRDFRSYLLRGKYQSRIYLILTTPPFLRQIMIEARKLGMASGEYVFIAIQPTKRPGVTAVSWRGNGTHEDDQMAIDAYKCLIVITGLVPDWKTIRNLTGEFSHVARTAYNYTYEDEENDMQISIYESTMMFAQVFDENYPDVVNMSKSNFIGKFNNRFFDFANRNFSTDSTGGKVSPVVIQRYNPESEQMETAMLFNTVTGAFYDVKLDLWYWTGRNDSPLDVPLCGFRNDSCDQTSRSGIVGGVLGACLVLLCIAAGCSIHIVLERRKELLKLWWLVDRSTVLFETADEPSEKSSIVQAFPGRKGRILKLAQRIYALSIETPDLVTVHMFQKQKKLLHVLLQLRYLDHCSLARFKGIAIDFRTIIFISEYAERSTLRALLDQPDHIALDGCVRFSLCWDVLEAVEYLHKSQLLCHGNLMSLTCVVDAKFRAKVTETGYAKIFSYLNIVRPSQTDRIAQKIEYIWKPKEVLWANSSAEVFRYSNTPECDIYAIGVIFYEIVTGNTPLHVDLDSLSSVAATVEELMSHGGFKIVLDHNEESLFPAGMKLMLESCLGPANLRPTARQLRSIFQKVSNRYTDVMGHILRRIETHAAELENVVSERTQSLEVEMAIADSLLQEMLPLEIVRLLRNKQPVPPQLFDNVTLMFSDMPAFEYITAHCGPLQIIDFLNTAYSLIDGVLPEFDVYKVETINDSYVVVSGLPHINGSQHVFEICRLALTLRKVARQIEDPFDASRLVLLRIGIHTGACVAGVIGSRMPRYCLFGDTMNTASRMESNGQAGKIHISSTTKERIAKSPNFETEPRGQVEIKGKGLMLTFWLKERLSYA